MLQAATQAAVLTGVQLLSASWLDNSQHAAQLEDAASERASLSLLAEQAWGFQRSAEMKQARACSSCGAQERQSTISTVKLQQCSGCKQAWYCGPSCLKEAWPRHKAACREAQAAAAGGVGASKEAARSGARS
jgi:hypothetical protein